MLQLLRVTFVSGFNQQTRKVRAKEFSSFSPSMHFFFVKQQESKDHQTEYSFYLKFGLNLKHFLMLKIKQMNKNVKSTLVKCSETYVLHEHTLSFLMILGQWEMSWCCTVHSSQSLFVFMNFNQRICKAPTCFHAYAEPHPPHKEDSCRLLTRQNNPPIHSHYTTACLFISSHLNCLAAIKRWKTKNNLH